MEGLDGDRRDRQRGVFSLILGDHGGPWTRGLVDW